MISSAEVSAWAARFGVARQQISRDHFVSHVLHAIGAVAPSIRFFGGTALCRTFLDESRLSEDIDLLDPDPRSTLDALLDGLPKALRREFPDTSSSTPLAVGDGYASTLEAPDLAPINIYVGRDGANTNGWTFDATVVQLRYSDLPPTERMQCPTLPTFAAMKLAAWFDRHAPRDLFDLFGLAARGVLAEPEVGARFGAKMGFNLIATEFERAPQSTVNAWQTELAAQVGSLPEVHTCLDLVHAALVEAANSNP